MPKPQEKRLGRLVVPFQLKAMAPAESGKPHTFEGLAATWDKDLGNDIIHRGAFKDTLAEWKAGPDAIPLLNSHNQYDVLAGIGQLTEGKETKDGLWTKWELLPGPEGDAYAARMQPSATTGKPIVGKMSIGYEPVEFKFEQPEGTTSYWDQIRHLTKVALKEVSLVLFPMNPNAAIDAATVKSMLLSADATDPRSVDPATKAYLRKLASRIGSLLKKQEDPDGTTRTKAGIVVPADLVPPAGPTGSKTDIEDVEDDDDELEDIEEPTEEQQDPPTDPPVVEDEEDGTKGEPAPKEPEEPEPQTYQYAEALKQRLQKVTLQHSLSEQRKH
jgi:HK97 family phage prohead protease